MAETDRNSNAPPLIQSTGCCRSALFIVVEGLDRSGKSTQCAHLAACLNQSGFPAKVIRFPDRSTPIGEVINKYLTGELSLDDHAIHLLFSANRWELAASIVDDVTSGTTIIADRYYYSGCVYSAAKDVPGLNLDWARRSEAGLPAPDVCIFLDLPEAEAEKRGGYGQEKYETIEMQRKVRKLFDAMMKTGEDHFRVVDATRSPGSVAYAILNIVLPELERADESGISNPLGTVRHLSPHG